MAEYRDYKELIVEKQDKILVITIYNPKKKNCVNRNAYEELSRVFREVAQDETVTLVVLTGKGEFFTAGNDISGSNGATDDLEAYMVQSNFTFSRMVSAIIETPQPIIALVNGPCIGIGTTLTGLVDIAWCSETAYFATPFTSLGIVPEAASSYLFPLIVGRSKASEMLLFSEKITAEEAFRYNLVSRIFKLSELDSVIWPKLREFAEMPRESVRASKRLLRMYERESVYQALREECNELAVRFKSEEFMNALIAFATRKQKSKM